MKAVLTALVYLNPPYDQNNKFNNVALVKIFRLKAGGSRRSEILSLQNFAETTTPPKVEQQASR